MRHWFFPTIILAAAFTGRPLSAETPESFNIAWKKLGSEQLWSDDFVYGSWRIQASAITGQYRLLDSSDVRRAAGTREQCHDAFLALKHNAKLPQLDGRAVITLHGFGRSRDHMAELGSLLEQHGKFTWINVSYASTRRSLDDHAESLAHIIDGLEGIDEINFVCHSLGNLIVRRYLGEPAQPNPRWKPDPRIERMVMLGPPNNGAELAQVIAELFNDNDFARFVAGPSAWQLARQWDETAKLLATPTFEFGIISGGFGDGRGLNPLLHGDDDLIVKVEETRLPGAADFRVVACRHGRLMCDPLVQPYVLSFLENGYFTSAAEKQPIVAAEPASPPR